ncbi:MAG: restriction endonuclease subunit S [Bacteroidota bacterium]|nr:restriction endonuclease subunit S [Bacteroidota bacterium]
MKVNVYICSVITRKLILKTTLKHIASIQTGVFAKPTPEGEVIYLQAKHFDESGQINTELHPDLKADAFAVKHLLRKGDVLFAAKGTKNFAAVYDIEKQAVASTSFFVVKLNDKFRCRILPEFLAWQMNHPVAQTYLKGQAMGSSIVSISKGVLEELEISIPPIQKQQLILNISRLRNKEIELRQQIEMLRDKQIQQQILNAIK